MEAISLLTRPGEGIYEEKRSRFLGIALPAHSEEEALEQIQKRRREHPDARHHCYAFTCGLTQERSRFSDDGEPSGTGGKPILDMLTGSGAHDAIVIVTRYFGGTLLGTGGLSRAYGTAASMALKNAEQSLLYSGREWDVTAAYADYAALDRYLKRQEISRLKEDFGATVELKLVLLPEEEEGFLRQAADLSSGAIRTKAGDEVRFFKQKERAVLWEPPAPNI